jgi:hypothetical protein
VRSNAIPDTKRKNKTMQRLRTTGKQHIDIFTPNTTHETILDNIPVLMLVHGGAWCVGSSESMHGMAKAFTDKGYVVVVPSYGLSNLDMVVVGRVFLIVSISFLGIGVHATGRASVLSLCIAVICFCIYTTILYMQTNQEQHHIKHPAHVLDIVRAIRWCKDHLQRLIPTCDVQSRLFLLGHSAGAHLVSLIGVTDIWLEHSNLTRDAIAGVISVSAPMSRLRINLFVEKLLVNSIFVDHTLATTSVIAHDTFAWPITAFDQNTPDRTPPFYLLVAEADLPGIASSNLDMAVLFHQHDIYYRYHVCVSQTHWTIRRFWNDYRNHDILIKVCDFITDVLDVH